MNTENHKTATKCDSVRDAEDTEKYPGVAVNCADNNAVNVKLVKERTKMLNNNPRNEDA